MTAIRRFQLYIAPEKMNFNLHVVLLIGQIKLKCLCGIFRAQIGPSAGRGGA